MSEIFEALLRAQRQRDSRQAEPQSASVSGDSAGIGSRPRVAEEAVLDPEKAGARRHRSVWLRLIRRGAGRNGHKKKDDTALILPADGSEFGEQFRVLRTSVEVAGPGSFMVTSPLGQEGKTVCAANLAVALSLRMEAGVILVDADLRRPSVGAHFGIRGGKGLTDCLTGEADWRQCLVSTKNERLRILPAGRRSAVAPELLGCERMRSVTAELRQEFPDHFLIFDTPPVLVTADPMVVGRHMDHVVLVVRAGVTPRAAALKVAETIGNERLLGVVLNDAAPSLYHYYHYQGGYSYNGEAETVSTEQSNQ